MDWAIHIGKFIQWNHSVLQEEMMSEEEIREDIAFVIEANIIIHESEIRELVDMLMSGKVPHVRIEENK